MVDLDFFGIRICRLVSAPAVALGFLGDFVGLCTAILSCSGTLLRLVRSGTGISIALGNLVKRSKSSILMSEIFSIFGFSIFLLTRNLSRLPPIFKSASPGRAPPIHGDALLLNLMVASWLLPRKSWWSAVRSKCDSRLGVGVDRLPLRRSPASLKGGGEQSCLGNLRAVRRLKERTPYLDVPRTYTTIGRGPIGGRSSELREP